MSIFTNQRELNATMEELKTISAQELVNRFKVYIEHRAYNQQTMNLEAAYENSERAHLVEQELLRRLTNDQRRTKSFMGDPSLSSSVFSLRGYVARDRES
jgi:hypothetical protein